MSQYQKLRSYILFQTYSIFFVQPDDWKEVSTLNSLTAVYELHCGGKPLEKATREVFVEGTMEDVRNDFQVSRVSLVQSSLRSSFKVMVAFYSHWKKYL